MDGLQKKYQRLLEEGTFADVTFVVGMDEEERIKAHKGILSVSSPLFHSLLLESGDEIHILDIIPSIFRDLLKYIYVNELPKLNNENWAPFLYAAEKYEMNDLKKGCIQFVDDNLTFENAVGYFNQGKKFQVDNLVPYIKNRIEWRAEEFLTSDSFLKIKCNEVLSAILSLDFNYCKEILIYRFAVNWASSKIKERGEEQNGATIREVLGPALYAIRFSRLSPNELNREVIPKGILTAEEMHSIVMKKESSPFIFGPRGDSNSRFDDYVRKITNVKYHSIKFKVDQKAKVEGMFIYRSWNVNKVIKGRAFIKDEQNAVLGENHFAFKHSSCCSSLVRFANPIFLIPNKWYTASIEYDSTPVEALMGINGHSEIKLNGVKLTFENDSLSEETNVFEGQISMILLSPQKK